MVHRRIGSGTYVNYIAQSDHEQIAETTSPLELIEVRLAVEPDIARMAVVNANARNLRELRDALLALEEAGDDSGAFSKADENFHLKMAQCSHNPLLVWIYQLINEVRGHTQWDASKDKILTPETIAEYNAQHRALYEAIELRDSTRAVRVITEHLNKAKSQFVNS
jgi:DNA-binding FadR family transcriptional regulator